MSTALISLWLGASAHRVSQALTCRAKQSIQTLLWVERAGAMTAAPASRKARAMPEPTMPGQWEGARLPLQQSGRLLVAAPAALKPTWRGFHRVEALFRMQFSAPQSC